MRVTLDKQSSKIGVRPTATGRFAEWELFQNGANFRGILP